MTTEAIIAEKPETLENLFSNPPGLILVFDNYRGATPEKRQVAEETMMVRSLLAAYIYHSNLYSNGEGPTLCCFAGEHEKDGEAGSEKVKKWLKLCGVPEEKIITRQTTNTTRTDITQLHSLAKEHNITEPLAIVTTDDHVKRTQQEIDNHFSHHLKKHGSDYNLPQIYVLSPSDERLDCLKSLYTSGVIQQIEKYVQGHSLDHGFSETLARLLSSHPWLRVLQPLAENIAHPHTPKKLARINKFAGKLN